MTSTLRALLRIGAPCIGVLVVSLSSCGGGGGGGAGGGLALVEFRQANVDSVCLNEVLRFDFSADVDPASVSSASIQVREGEAYGLSVEGEFEVDGARVLFRPRLPGLCDLSDAGFRAATQYRVSLVGLPEEFSVRNTHGQPLGVSISYEFATRGDNDPDRYIDRMPGSPPTVLEVSPDRGAAAVSTGSPDARQRITIAMSENLDPCSVGLQSVSVHVYEVGGTLAESVTNPDNGKLSGFVTGADDVGDQNPSDSTTWGSDTGDPWPGGAQALPVSVHLDQNHESTKIIVSPLFGQDPRNPVSGGVFPDNVLIVVRLDADIRDFSGTFLPTDSFSFTVENKDSTPGEYVMEVEGETPFTLDGTTADVNTARAPSLVQGYLLFSGDGDNGKEKGLPSLPETPTSGCNQDRQSNDGTLDHFDPDQDMVLDTGASVNTCPNEVDGSTAVVWEFKSFRIRNGITVRIVGVNPAIILVQGDINIDSGGRLSARSDGTGGSPRGRGRNGFNWTSGSSSTALGGTGVVGGGDGGSTRTYTSTYGKDGFSPFGSPDGFDQEGGHGAGLGGVGHNSTYPGPDYGSAQGGGGGGHGTKGGTSTNVLGPLQSSKGAAKGTGGEMVTDDSLTSERMLTPSAGGGGGGAGNDQWSGSYTSYGTGGGSGGAGGGFVDLTCSGNIFVNGTIDVSGCRGGNAGSPYTGTNKSSGGGGGGGAGGGIRLLTPNGIILGALAVVTAAGGQGGLPPTQSQGQNFGGTGGNGRIVMEDGDTVIPGLAGATVIPGDGQDGFYRGVFDATRFKGGGLTPTATTDLILVGPLNPIYVDPRAEDFIAGAPPSNTQGLGSVVIEVEAEGYPVLQDGTPATGAGTGLQVVGRFTDSGVETEPTWTSVNGLSGLSGNEFLKLRFTFYLSAAAGPFDPGSYIDTWTLRFVSDN